MSSHREAPGISQDPVADSTDLYAFVSHDRPDMVTIIANYVPLQGPAGGPNFYSFGDDVLYEINIDNTGSGTPDITYQFQFNTEIANPGYFLYNTGQITSIDSPNWNLKQFYSVTRVDSSGSTVLGSGLPCPPCNIGPRSIPHYEPLAEAAIQSLGHGMRVFCGQRAEGFYVDLGAIFDLGDLRPFQHLHLIPSADAVGVDATKSLNIHTIALQVPISELTADGSSKPHPMSSTAVIGVWSGASRRKVRIADPSGGAPALVGPWVQVSRLGNPLFNEVIVPMSLKDRWNAGYPVDDEAFVSHVQQPELAGLLPVLYPGVFPNLAGLTAPRADLVAILLTGLPAGIVPGFQNYTGTTLADQLRLNVAIPPSSSPNVIGLLGGDAAGFPNGRRVFDDVVSIELRAIAGLSYPLVDKSYTPDGAAAVLTEGLTPASNRYQSMFPYLAPPLDGFDNPAS